MMIVKTNEVILFSIFVLNSQHLYRLFCHNSSRTFSLSKLNMTTKATITEKDRTSIYKFDAPKTKLLFSSTDTFRFSMNRNGKSYSMCFYINIYPSDFLYLSNINEGLWCVKATVPREYDQLNRKIKKCFIEKSFEYSSTFWICCS